MTATTGCRGHRAITAREPQQALLSNKAPDACGYDTTFDEVSGVGSETISLSDYLVWATTYLPATVNNASLIDAWIGYFHRYGCVLIWSSDLFLFILFFAS